MYALANIDQIDDKACENTIFKVHYDIGIVHNYIRYTYVKD